MTNSGMKYKLGLTFCKVNVTGSDHKETKKKKQKKKTNKLEPGKLK